MATAYLDGKIIAVYICDSAFGCKVHEYYVTIKNGKLDYKLPGDASPRCKQEVIKAVTHEYNNMEAGSDVRAIKEKIRSVVEGCNVFGKDDHYTIEVRNAREVGLPSSWSARRRYGGASPHPLGLHGGARERHENFDLHRTIAGASAHSVRYTRPQEIPLSRKYLF